MILGVNIMIHQNKEINMFHIVNQIKDLGIHLIITSLDNSQSGFIVYDENTKLFSITINANHGVKRQNFTMAHELAHYVLHKDIVMQRGQLDRDSSNLYSNEDKILEREANRLAGNLLMPLQAIRDIISINNFDINNQEHIQQIADIFVVSEEALKIQMRNL